MKKAIFAFLLLIGPRLSAGPKPCDLLKTFPHRGIFQLKNGQEISVPAHASNVDTYTVFAWLNYTMVSEILRAQNLFPVNINGRALGALSLFDYKASDIGSFKESYFVIFAVPQRNAGLFSHFSDFYKLVTAPSNRPPRKVVLFHQSAWSNSPTAVLLSEEVWGIPSILTDIEILSDTRRHFAVRIKKNPVFEMTWRNDPKIPNPLDHDLFLYAVGPRQGSGKSKWSPVKSCGSSFLGPFAPARGDSLSFNDFSIHEFMNRVGFSPFMKAAAFGRQAVQFLPDPQ